MPSPNLSGLPPRGGLGLAVGAFASVRRGRRGLAAVLAVACGVALHHLSSHRLLLPFLDSSLAFTALAGTG